eukprot:995263-Amphidinium_carterae.1
MSPGLAEESVRKMDTFNPQSIANTAWAFAALEIVNRPLIDSLAAAALAHVQDFNVQALSNLSWSLARMDYLNAKLMDAIAQAGVQNNHHMPSVRAHAHTRTHARTHARTHTDTHVHTHPVHKQPGSFVTVAFCSCSLVLQ